MHNEEQTSGSTLQASPQLTFDLLKTAKMLSFLLNLCLQLPNQPTKHETKFNNFRGDDDSNTIQNVRTLETSYQAHFKSCTEYRRTQFLDVF